MNNPEIEWKETSRELIFECRGGRPWVKAWLVTAATNPRTGVGPEFLTRQHYEITSVGPRSPEKTDWVIHAADLILANFYLYGRDWSRYLDILKKLVLLLNAWRTGDIAIVVILTIYG